MRRFRDALAEAMNASQRDVDRTLLGCREHVQSGTKPVLEPDATYVSLFTERTGVNGVKEVLVYDAAKHQVFKRPDYTFRRVLISMIFRFLLTDWS